MSFDVAADAYDRYMGRYSRLLSPQLADFAGVRAGQRALDVGCGPGALTAELVARLGASAVSAVDPSESFVAAARGRNPGVEVLRASAEQLPFSSGVFDAAIAPCGRLMPATKRKARTPESLRWVRWRDERDGEGNMRSSMRSCGGEPPSQRGRCRIPG